MKKWTKEEIQVMYQRLAFNLNNSTSYAMELIGDVMREKNWSEHQALLYCNRRIDKWISMDNKANVPAQQTEGVVN